MEIYISDKFLASIDNILNIASNDILSGRATNITALFKLLMALPLNVNASELNTLPSEYKHFKDIIIKNAIKKNQLNNNPFEKFNEKIENLSAFYFTDKIDAEEISIKKGIVFKGPEFNCDSFYNDCTIADLQINNSWEPVKDCIPPVNAMLIVDQYIFGKPFEKKLSSLRDFLKLFIKKMDVPFHLSILHSPDNCSPAQMDTVFKTLTSLNNIELRLYAGGKIPRSDRLIFTNYTTGNIGHPFDDRDTRFTQNFLGNENSEEKIIRNYRDYKKDLTFWNNYLNRIPREMCNVKSIWETSDFKNRLFKPFLDK